ncbi:MAG: Holliday junction resolvase-like protein [Ignavibacteriaceae bacterium]|nr:Holliday junction resolvase-like protein [Ignavibacteriaceae bacterium]
MNLNHEAHAIITTLEQGGIWAQCPCCEEPIKLKDAGLFFLDDFSDEAEVLYKEYLADLKERREELKRMKENISTKSEIGAKAVNLGFIMERIAPSLKSFKFFKNDCRSLFDPIDYIIFEGLESNNQVSKIIFSDIKTGNAKLTQKQKQIKKVVEKKKVEFNIYKSE